MNKTKTVISEHEAGQVPQNVSSGKSHRGLNAGLRPPAERRSGPLPLTGGLPPKDANGRKVVVLGGMLA